MDSRIHTDISSDDNSDSFSKFDQNDQNDQYKNYQSDQDKDQIQNQTQDENSNEESNANSISNSNLNTNSALNVNSSTSKPIKNSFRKNRKIYISAPKKIPAEPRPRVRGYRRARAARACLVCHSRKVRCDVTQRIPCTNCVAFNCKCTIPETKRKVNTKDFASSSTQANYFPNSSVNSIQNSPNNSQNIHPQNTQIPQFLSPQDMQNSQNMLAQNIQFPSPLPGLYTIAHNIQLPPVSRPNKNYIESNSTTSLSNSSLSLKNSTTLTDSENDIPMETIIKTGIRTNSAFTNQVQLSSQNNMDPLLKTNLVDSQIMPLPDVKKLPNYVMADASSINEFNQTNSRHLEQDRFNFNSKIFPTVNHVLTPMQTLVNTAINCVTPHHGKLIENNTEKNSPFSSDGSKAGRLTYLGMSSPIGAIYGFDTFHNFATSAFHTSYSLNSRSIDKDEIDLLKSKGALLIPPAELADDLIECYFRWIHPCIPVINRTSFMRQYNDPQGSPSLLLLQTVFLLGTLVCKNQLLIDKYGTHEGASRAFYKRAKALYDASYEANMLVVIQSLILLGYWYEGRDDMSENSYYWTNTAIMHAQALGMQRNVCHLPFLTKAETKIWKRIWWVLYVRDRMVAAGLGRPMFINSDEIDVEELTESDFEEGDVGLSSPFEFDFTMARWFISLVKLTHILDYVLKNMYSLKAQRQLLKTETAPDLSVADNMLSEWLHDLPGELKYDSQTPDEHTYFGALLHVFYYNVILLVNRQYISKKCKSFTPYRKSSLSIALHAAQMITCISMNLLDFGEIQCCPAFILCVFANAKFVLFYSITAKLFANIDSLKYCYRFCTKCLVVMAGKFSGAYAVLRSFVGLENDANRENSFLKVVDLCPIRLHVPPIENSESEDMVSSSDNSSGPLDNYTFALQSLFNEGGFEYPLGYKLNESSMNYLVRQKEELDKVLEELLQKITGNSSVDSLQSLLSQYPEEI